MDKNNRQQKQIIESKDKRIVVLACPGSGKTTTLINKIVQLASSGVPLKRILCVTFTRKAANEMLERLSKQVVVSKSERGNFCTLHSFGCRILYGYKDLVGLREEYSVAVKAEQMEIVRELLPETMNAEGIATAFLEYVSSIKNGFEKNDKFNFTLDQFNAYTKRMIEKNLIDIDDYIYLPVKILSSHPFVKEKISKRFDYVYVDEYQDINKIQNDFLDLLIGSHTNVLYVGDDDQSIYEFRGSNPNFILEKSAKDSGFKVFFLTRNYRSQEPIVALSKKILSNLSTKNRRQKEIVAEKKSSRVKPIRHQPFPNKQAEIEFVVNEIYRLATESLVEPNEIAVLCRYTSKKNLAGLISHPELSEIGNELRKRGIPASMSMPSEGDSGASRCIKSLCQALSFFAKESFDANICNVIRQNSFNTKRFSQILELINLQYGSKLNADTDFVSLMTEIDSMSIHLSDDHFQSRLESLQKAYRFAKRQFDAVHNGSLPSEIISNLLVYFSENSPLDDATRAIYEYALLFAKSAEESYGEDDVVSSKYQAIVKSAEQFLFEQDEAANKNSVRLLTAHQSKGLQFDVVFVVGLEAGGFPSNFEPLDEQNLDNERRLFYVCVTRARELLYLSATGYAVDNSKDLADKSFIYNLPSSYFDDRVNSFSGISFSQSQRGAFGAQIESKDAIISQLEEERFICLTRLYEQEDVITALEAKLDQLNAQGEDTTKLKEQLTKARKSLVLYRDEINKKDAYISALQDALNDMGDKTKTLESATQSAMDKLKKEYQDKFNRLSQQAEANAREKKELERQIEAMTKKDEVEAAVNKVVNRIETDTESVQGTDRMVNIVLNQIVSFPNDIVPSSVKEIIKKAFRIVVIENKYPFLYAWFTSGLANFCNLVSTVHQYVNGAMDRPLYENKTYAYSYKNDLSVVTRKIIEIMSNSKTILGNRKELLVYLFLKEYLEGPHPYLPYSRLVANFKAKSDVALDADLARQMKTMYILSSMSPHDKDIQNSKFEDYRTEMDSFFDQKSLEYSISVFASFFVFLGHYLDKKPIMKAIK